MKKFTLPKQICDLVAMLPVEEQGYVYSALFAFIFEGEDRSATLSGLGLAIYNLSVLAAKPQIARARYRARKKAEAAARAAREQGASAAGLPVAAPDDSTDVAASVQPEVVERVGKYSNFRPADPAEAAHPKRRFEYVESLNGREIERRAPFCSLPKVLAQEACALGWGVRV